MQQYHLKELEKVQTKPKTSRRKEIIKIKAEILKRDVKQKKRKKINTPKICFLKDQQN